MITAENLYWYFTLTRIVEVVEVIASILAIASFIAMVAAFFTKKFADTSSFEEDAAKALPIFVKIFVVSIVFVLISLFIPSKKEFAIIFIAPKIAQNKDIQELPSNIVKYANEAIKNEIDKLLKKESK